MINAKCKKNLIFKNRLWIGNAEQKIKKVSFIKNKTEYYSVPQCPEP